MPNRYHLDRLTTVRLPLFCRYIRYSHSPRIAGVRFDRLTVLQQKYLRAMAELGPGPHKTGGIAATLGVGATSVATVRQQLVNKGMVWSQRHGETAFTVPLFDSFMKRQMPKLEKHVPARRKRSTRRPARP